MDMHRRSSLISKILQFILPYVCNIISVLHLAVPESFAVGTDKTTFLTGFVKSGGRSLHKTLLSLKT